MEKDGKGMERAGKGNKGWGRAAKGKEGMGGECERQRRDGKGIGRDMKGW